MRPLTNILLVNFVCASVDDRKHDRDQRVIGRTILIYGTITIGLVGSAGCWGIRVAREDWSVCVDGWMMSEADQMTKRGVGSLWVGIGVGVGVGFGGGVRQTHLLRFRATKKHSVLLLPRPPQHTAHTLGPCSLACESTPTRQPTLPDYLSQRKAHEISHPFAFFSIPSLLWWVCLTTIQHKGSQNKL